MVTWIGGPLNGFFLGSIGEFTEVASVKRAVFGDLRLEDEEELSESEDEVRERTMISGKAFFSPFEKVVVVVIMGGGGGGCDMVVIVYGCSSKKVTFSGLSADLSSAGA